MIISISEPLVNDLQSKCVPLMHGYNAKKRPTEKVINVNEVDLFKVQGREPLVKAKKYLSSKSGASSKKHKKKSTVAIKPSVDFIKRIARLPAKDRREILKVLKKHECKRSVLS
jgi:hypothetical protein